MRHFLAAVLFSALVVFVQPAHAGFEESRTWFESLPGEERSNMQADLTLLGFYEYLVDGQFGNGTFQALTQFQDSLGRAQTGVLLNRDKDRLTTDAAAVYAELGMDLVRDKEGQAALILPAGLLSVTAATARGNSYSTPDGGISLTTARRPIGETSFSALFNALKTPGDGRFITYSNYNDERFVVTGKNNGIDFYTMFQNAETDSVGYTLAWEARYAERAEMLAVFIASPRARTRVGGRRVPGARRPARMSSRTRR
jgi:peptidoglycan hydrolase-like protein with peptidoglycan-binding domain